jgi:hypothetical protein
MNQAVRDITANISSRLPQECAALLEKALLEVHRWHIIYDDEYFEDYDISEMVAFGINKESGSIKISPATPKMIIAVDPEDTNPNPWIAVKSKSSKKSDNNPVPSTTTSSDKKGCLCGCSSKVILTVANEPFQELCMRMPGVETKSYHKCLAYYSYIRNFHNYGHMRISGPGYSFPDPFDKRRYSAASRMLHANVPFPIPNASVVEAAHEVTQAAHKLNSDALNPDFQASRLTMEAFQYAQASVLCAESNSIVP